MNRLLKFRYWNAECREMKYFILTDLDGEKCVVDNTDIVNQYAGVKDHKGTHIFEGDILLAYDKHWEVVFSEGCFIAIGPGRSKALRTMYCEVIGNIYENPNIRIAR